MAEPIEFDESNGALGAPVDMTEEQCGTLPVFKIPGLSTMSVWKLTEGEKARILKTGEICLTVYAGGYTQPPVSLGAYFPDSAAVALEAHRNQQG